MLGIARHPDNDVVVEAENQRSFDGLDVAGLARAGSGFGDRLPLQSADDIADDREGLLGAAIDLERLQVGIGLALQTGCPSASVDRRVRCCIARSRECRKSRRIGSVGGDIGQARKLEIDRQEQQRPRQLHTAKQNAASGRRHIGQAATPDQRQCQKAGKNGGRRQAERRKEKIGRDWGRQSKEAMRNRRHDQ